MQIINTFCSFPFRRFDRGVDFMFFVISFVNCEFCWAAFCSNENNSVFCFVDVESESEQLENLEKYVTAKNPIFSLLTVSLADSLCTGQKKEYENGQNRRKEVLVTHRNASEHARKRTNPNKYLSIHVTSCVFLHFMFLIFFSRVSMIFNKTFAYLYVFFQSVLSFFAFICASDYCFIESERWMDFIVSLYFFCFCIYVWCTLVAGVHSKISLFTN